MTGKDQRDPLPHLRAGENAGRGLARVVRDCCERAAGFRGAEPDESAVHVARKALKRARAILRLGETLEVGGAKRIRRQLAVRGRELSARRDATVGRGVAERLARKARGAEAVSVRLEKRRRRNGSGPWAEWKARVKRQTHAIEKLEWGNPTRAEVRRGLERAARRVCKRARTAREDGEIASAHEWRKAVIVLREQALVTRNGCGKKRRKIAARLDRLAHWLGKAMDYEVFLKMAEPEATGRLGRIAKVKRRRALEKAWTCWPKMRRWLREMK